MRRLLDADHSELRLVLEAMLKDNADISVRAVARRHPQLKNASAFTRSDLRMRLIADAQTRQEDARAIANRVRGSTVRQVPCRDREQAAEIETLKGRLEKLVAGHASLIRAVQLAGGMNALERFWRDYKSVADEIRRSGAAGAAGMLVSISEPKLKPKPKNA